MLFNQRKILFILIIAINVSNDVSGQINSTQATV